MEEGLNKCEGARKRDSLRELWKGVFRRVVHLGGVSVQSQFGIIVVGVIDANVSPYYLINSSSSSSSHVTPRTHFCI